MLRLCGQLSKNAVHLNSHKNAVLVFSCSSEFVLPRKLDKTGLHKKTSPTSAFLELRNSLSREQTRRIMRETQVQPLNNNEVTRWAESDNRQERAHGTQKHTTTSHVLTQKHSVLWWRLSAHQLKTVT